jgi:hypothetical protein
VIPSRERFFRRGQKLAQLLSVIVVFGYDIFLSYLFFTGKTALRQSARFLRKNRPRSAALQRAGEHI